ncbi:hypothetical protein SEA_OTTAWA_46 [Arthrobacter phage Ottawa]|nr:minor tail protein [Arthrobacter phage Kharcho]WIC89278.1 hypothetical protein SEA_OTTAWA_46 [Arthrobacter phage Ottawa]
MAGNLGVTDLSDVFSDIGSTGSTVSIQPGELRRSETNAWEFHAGGQPMPVIFTANVIPYSGAPAVAIVRTPPKGLSTAWVVGVSIGSAYQGGVGKVLVVNGDGVTISAEIEGKTVTGVKRMAHYTPVVNDTCLIDWRGGNAYATGKIGSPPPPPPAPTAQPAPAAPPPPPAPITGTSKFTAQASGTWTTGYNWNSYFGTNVYSGSGYVPPSSGHWFYNGATRGLSDKGTITSVRFYLPARRQAGAYNATAAVKFYRHNHNSKGASVPGLTTGPHTVNVAPGWGGGYISLPASFGTALKAGGGISISGDPYVGFTGISGAANSGHLVITWKKG